MNWRHRRSAGVGMSAVDDRAHAARVVNNATPQHTLDYWRETEEPAASLNDPLHYRQHEVNLVTAYHHSGRHWRQPRRGCRGHIPPNILVGGTSTGISPPILFRTFGYSRPILVALRSLSLKPFTFGYKTPPIRLSQAGGQSAHKARPPNLQLALTPLVVAS